MEYEGRRSKVYEIPNDGKNRDGGKKFKITEMDAWEGERWATRVILAMSESGIDVPEGVMNSPTFETLASFGINALLRVRRDRFEELSDQLLSCVKVVTDTGITRDWLKSDFNEISTLFKLRLEVLKFHMEAFTGGSVLPSA